MAAPPPCTPARAGAAAAAESSGSGGAAGTGGAAGSGGSITDGGAGGSAGGGTGGSAGGGTGGSAGGSADAGQCKTPSTLHPPKAGDTATIYCPFSSTDGGKNDYCTPQTQHCCEGSGAGSTSSCVAAGTACATGDTDWQCEDPADCPTGTVCCGTGTLVVNSDPMCANYASHFTGTNCAASCAAGEITMCTSDGECGGKTCVPFETKGNQVGGCQ